MSLDRRAFLRAFTAAAGAAALPGCGRVREEEVVTLRVVERQLAYAFARAFGLRHDEDPLFDAGWRLYDRMVGLIDRRDRAAALRALHEEAVASVSGAMRRLREAVEGRPVDLRGYRHVGRLPIEGPYVVTSDHHASFHGHRTNFFQRSGNLWLYVQAMRHYLDAGYTLVENGDVEELVIFDPTYEPGEVESRQDLDLDALIARRQVVRARQLERNLADPANRAVVEIRAAFDADRRLVRLAGNHDYDTQRDELLALLRSRYPNLERPYDLVLLEGGDRPGVRFAIAHGHQFDVATNPVSGPRFGETISETLGVYYQGADRVWLWGPDGVADWAIGERPFANQLATREAGLSSALDQQVDNPEAPFGGAPERTRAIARMRGLLERGGESVLEHLFKQGIAWQYFLDRDPATGLVEPARAVVDEVFTGDRFFKYELLDEEFVRRELLDAFPDPAERPTLLLGHSHEPRASAWSSSDDAPFPWYLNTASAGQYENLLWAAEIVGGEASIVSWSLVPPPVGPLERRVWRSGADGPWARADRTPSPVPR
jgi:hypothetical protein